MNYKKANSLCNVFSVNGLVIGLFLYLFEEVNFWFYSIGVLALIFVLIGVVIKAVFYRCPHCQGSLPFRTRIPEFCPNCGEKLFAQGFEMKTMFKGYNLRAIVFLSLLVAAVLCGIVVFKSETVDKFTSPAVSIYDEAGSVLLTADVNTEIIALTTSVEVEAAYRDNTGESSVWIYCASLDSDAEPRLLGGASRDVSNADDIKSTAVWNVAEEYPDGFDGSVWAVASASDGVEQTSDYVRVVYDPANVPTQTEFNLPVTLYTYSGDILNPIAEKLSVNKNGQITLPDTVFIKIDMPSSVIRYKLYCRPEEGEALILRTVSYQVSNVDANLSPDIRSFDGKLWDVWEDFPDGFTGEIYAVASSYARLEENEEPVRVIYEPN